MEEQFGSVTVTKVTNKNKAKGKGTKQIKNTGKSKKLDIKNDLEVDIDVESVKNI